MLQIQTRSSVMDVNLSSLIKEKHLLATYKSYRGKVEHADKAFVIKPPMGAGDSVKVRVDEVLDIMFVEYPLPEPIIK